MITVPTNNPTLTGTLTLAQSATVGFIPYANISGTPSAPTNVPIYIQFNSVAIGSGGASPVDIATIAIPAQYTRYVVMSLVIEALTAGGSLAAATFDLRTATGGGGISLLTTPQAANGLTGANTFMQVAMAAIKIGAGTSGGLNVVSTASALTIRQTVDSANTGTIAGFIVIIPIP